jgi:hypothetical protein
MHKPRLPSRRESILAKAWGTHTCRWGWSITLMLLVLSVDAGCSRPRKPAEDVNWGQSTPSVARRTPPRERRSERASGETTAASSGEGQESGVGPSPGEVGKSNDVGSSEENEQGVADPPISGAGEAHGEGKGVPGGASDTPPRADHERPAPALPGREPVKPTLSAAEAAQSAQQLLKRAKQLLRAADASAAAEVAIEAYDQVLPHAESNAECKKLCRQLEGVLNAAGRGRADAVPTRFE